MDIRHYLKTYIWLIILIAISISFVYPAFGLTLKPYLGYLLMALMFLSCICIDAKKIITQLHEYKRELTVLAIVHLLSPVIVFFLKPFFSEEIFLGLIIATVIPSGMSVVFLSHIYGGLPSTALIITSISNMFSPLIVPPLVLLFARTSIEVDTFQMALTMIKLVLIPAVLALIIRKTKFKAPLEKHSSDISLLVLFFLIIGVVSPVRDIFIQNIKLSLTLSILIIALTSINFLVGFNLGKTSQQKITYGISSTYKNFTLSTVIALSLFSPTVALPSIVYTVVNNIFLIPLQLIFLKKEKHIHKQ